MLLNLRLLANLLSFVAMVSCLPLPALADGVKDNTPENVRRIPEVGVPVPDERAASMRASLKKLQDKIAEINAGKDEKSKVLLPDVMIFERAVRCALDYNEFFDVKEFDRADALLAEGTKRADQLLASKPEWITQKGLAVRGYISRIDNTVQPYGMVIPPTYAIDNSVPTRCDIWFHGRGEKLSEVNFLWDRMHNPGEFTPEHTIMLHPYGRYCNAFKFAGEVDVLEALEDVQKHYRIDEDRISVRGFSMGGAACWQFATHYSDRWFAANPGAGFSETPQFLKVFQKEELTPTLWEQALWNLYDCDKWALNLTHCPTIAYSGENDSQKQAADVMEKALAEHGIRLRHVIGKGMGHRYDAESKVLVNKSLKSLASSSEALDHSQQATLETFSLRYNQMHWLRADGLDSHWHPARVEAAVQPTFVVKLGRGDGRGSSTLGITDRSGNTRDGLTMKLQNVRMLTVCFAAGMAPFDLRQDMVPVNLHDSIDGRAGELFDQIEVPGPASDGSWQFTVQRPIADGRNTSEIAGDRSVSAGWKLVSDSVTEASTKRHNLQGPIDDAFMDSFIFVRPTGTAANEAVGEWANAELTRAIEHWRRHFRGDARVVNDTDVTDEMIQSANLILWGDPKSNSIMAKIADKLPIQWTADKITVGEKSYEAKNHAPILIQPNPLNLNRYVVLNSSFTFRDYAYLNNARQVPMLPDWAIIDLNTPPNSVWPGKVVAADFFDEQWQLKP